MLGVFLLPPVAAAPGSGFAEVAEEPSNFDGRVVALTGYVDAVRFHRLSSETAYYSFVLSEFPRGRGRYVRVKWYTKAAGKPVSRFDAKAGDRLELSGTFSSATSSRSKDYLGSVEMYGKLYKTLFRGLRKVRSLR